MKKRLFFGLPAVILVIGLILGGCSDPADSPTGSTVEPAFYYSTTSDGEMVKVAIYRTDPDRAVLTPQNNDYYIIWVNEVIVSSGKITVSNTIITFTPGENSPGSTVSFIATITNTTTGTGTEAIVISTITGLTVPGTNISDAGVSTPATTNITFSGVTANGSSNQTTTQLTLTFSHAVTGLTASDITLSGVSGLSKGALSGSGPTYTLPISGFTSGGNLSVAVAKSGYTISGSPKTVTIYHYTPPTAVSLNNVTANGSTNQTTTQLTLTFSQAINGLTANDITLNGVSVTKGALSGSGPAYTLPISGFTSGGNLSVTVGSPAGYNVSGSPKTVTIYHYTPPTAVSLNNVTANGSTNQTTTQLTLTFSQAITGLTANDITLNGVSGVTKGTLSGSGPAYTLPISGFTRGGDLRVDVVKSGYTISGSPKTAAIFYYTSSSGGSTISGNTIASGLDVDYPPTIAVPTDFGYYYNSIAGNNSPLTNVINSPSVRITNGKVTIILGAPTQTAFSSPDWFIESYDISPTTAKCYFLPDFRSQDGFLLMCQKGSGEDAALVYASSAATLTGKTANNQGQRLSLMQGWNYILFGTTISATTTLPSGYQWKVRTPW